MFALLFLTNLPVNLKICIEKVECTFVDLSAAEDEAEGAPKRCQDKLLRAYRLQSCFRNVTELDQLKIQGMLEAGVPDFQIDLAL